MHLLCVCGTGGLPSLRCGASCTFIFSLQRHGRLSGAQVPTTPSTVTILPCHLVQYATQFMRGLSIVSTYLSVSRRRCPPTPPPAPAATRGATERLHHSSIPPLVEVDVAQVERRRLGGRHLGVVEQDPAALVAGRSVDVVRDRVRVRWAANPFLMWLGIGSGPGGLLPPS